MEDKDFDFAELFRDDDEGGLLAKMVPYVSLILGFITLLILIFRK